MPTVVRKKTGRVHEAKTREAILLAAIEEFASNGFAGARTENIARQAAVNKAMLHYYFHDKETLYASVLDTLFGSLPDADAMVRKLTEAPLTSLQHIHIFLRIILFKHGDPRSNSFRRILAWELAAGQANLKRVAQKYMVPRIISMSEIIKKGVAAGELKCTNPVLAVWSLISQVAFYFMHRETYEGSAIYDDLYKNISQDDLLSFLLENFIAAYATKPDVDATLPAEIVKMADGLAVLLVNPAIPVTG
jgi:TetR/AcrR family transcriptional regulator